MCRRLAAALAVAAIAVAGAAAAPGDPQRRIDAAETAKARSVLLKRADLAAGWKAGKPAPDEPLDCEGYSTDESDLTVTADVRSPDFTQKASVVASAASVYVSATQAATSWSRQIRPKLLDCMVSALREELAGEATLKVLAKRRLPLARVAPRAAHYRLVLELAVGERRARLHNDIVVLGRGRMNVALYFTAMGGPFAARDVAGLTRLTAARLAATGF
ncbi:MAG TPA: hypothetical protein VM204_07490 [Gaiellaceae bacterium]|nr:hypothetical protein [Gaiellaceae bacterium]